MRNNSTLPQSRSSGTVKWKTSLKKASASSICRREKQYQQYWLVSYPSPLLLFPLLYIYLLCFPHYPIAFPFVFIFALSFFFGLMILKFPVCSYPRSFVLCIYWNAINIFKTTFKYLVCCWKLVLSFKFLFVYFYFMCMVVLPACVSVICMWCLQRLEERWFWASMWVLEVEPQSSGRAAVLLTVEWSPNRFNLK